MELYSDAQGPGKFAKNESNGCSGRVLRTLQRLKQWIEQVEVDHCVDDDSERSFETHPVGEESENARGRGRDLDYLRFVGHFQSPQGLLNIGLEARQLAWPREQPFRELNKDLFTTLAGFMLRALIATICSLHSRTAVASESMESPLVRAIKDEISLLAFRRDWHCSWGTPTQIESFSPAALLGTCRTMSSGHGPSLALTE